MDAYALIFRRQDPRVLTCKYCDTNYLQGQLRCRSLECRGRPLLNVDTNQWLTLAPTENDPAHRNVQHAGQQSAPSVSQYIAAMQPQGTRVRARTVTRKTGNRGFRTSREMNSLDEAIEWRRAKMYGKKAKSETIFKEDGRKPYIIRMFNERLDWARDVQQGIMSTYGANIERLQEIYEA